jgi:TPR repeat protein
MLGLLYESGKGEPQDYGQAMSLFRKAADQGNVDAYDNIAYLYLQGLGVAADTSQARAWYQKAADAGDQAARDWLAQNPS